MQRQRDDANVAGDDEPNKRRREEDEENGPVCVAPKKEDEEFSFAIPEPPPRPEPTISIDGMRVTRMPQRRFFADQTNFDFAMQVYASTRRAGDRSSPYESRSTDQLMWELVARGFPKEELARDICLDRLHRDDRCEMIVDLPRFYWEVQPKVKVVMTAEQSALPQRIATDWNWSGKV